MVGGSGRVGQEQLHVPKLFIGLVKKPTETENFVFYLRCDKTDDENV